jgi:predicted PurR-regulated permease PerM
MLDRLSAQRRNIALLVLAGLVLWFAWEIRAVLNPLLVGYLCAYILHPLVQRVEHLGLTRRMAVNLIFCAGFVTAVVIALGLIVQSRQLAQETVVNAKASRETVQARLDRFGERLAGLGLDVGRIEVPELSELDELGQELLRRYGDDVQAATGAGLHAAGRTLAFVSRLLGKILAVAGFFLLVPLYTYYLLFELERLHSFVRRYLPRRERVRLSAVAEQVGDVVASFFRGRLGVCLVKGTMLSLGLWIAGVPYALLFGMGSGFLSLIPFVGPFIGFAGATAVALLRHDVLSAFLRTGIVFGLGEVVEGYVLIPKILGDSLGLHPVVVIFALLEGGAAFGTLGILLALPVTATLVILAREFVLPALARTVDDEAVGTRSP